MFSSTLQSYIFEDDIYYESDPYALPERLTTSGEAEGIRNGMSFWNYGGTVKPALNMYYRETCIERTL